MKSKTPKSFFEKVDLGVKKGAARALADHKKRGQPIVVWKNGKVTYIPAKKIKVPRVK